jgi:arylformamidase
VASNIYRNYDQEELDWWYNARGRCKEVEKLKRDQEKGSDSCRQNYRCELNIRIGDTPREALDIYYPKGEGPFPIHIFFHGGYWKSNNKESSAYVADSLVPFGAIAVIAEYTLIPEVRMDELLRQCRQAVSWVWKNAEKIGGRQDQITISGHSAGGHITASMLATDWPSYDSTMPTSPLKAAVATSGLYDLSPVQLCSQNDDLNLSDEEVQNFSPINQAPKCQAKVWLPVGGDEGPEFIRQTEEMAASWAAKGVQIHSTVESGHDHFTIMNQHMDGDCDFAKRLRDHLGIS